MKMGFKVFLGDRVACIGAPKVRKQDSPGQAQRRPGLATNLTAESPEWAQRDALVSPLWGTTNKNYVTQGGAALALGYLVSAIRAKCNSHMLVLLQVNLIGCVTLFLSFSSLHAGGNKSHCHVKAAAFVSNTVADGKRAILVTLEIEKGYYVLANPVNIDFLESGATRVKVVRNSKPIAADVKYPAGRTKKDGNFDFAIYEGSVVISLHVAADVDASSLTISLNIQAEGGGVCLLPSTIKLTPGVMP